MEKVQTQTKELDLKEMSYDELNELVQKNAEGFSKSHNTKVYGLLLNTGKGYYSTEGEWAIAYVKEPSLYQTFTIIDSIDGENKTLRGFQLFQKNVIKENSTMEYFNEKDLKNKKVIVGASLAMVGLCNDFSINQSTELKKNGE